MRLDQYLLECELASDEREARGLIMRGDVLVNDAPIDKPGHPVKEGDQVRVRVQREFVARSGAKLKAALEEFSFGVENKTFIDVGASTGGFTQVLLERGAAAVIALDVAYGFLHPSLRDDVRVTVMERTNVREIAARDLPCRPDAFVMDVSFISPLTVLQHLQSIISPWQGIVLFKPQFFVDSDRLKNGIVVDGDILEQACHDFEAKLSERNIQVRAQMASPLKGARGNQEYLYWLQWA